MHLPRPSPLLQDSVVVDTNPDGTPVLFLHPLLQTQFMFAGEAACLVAYLIYWHGKRLLQPRFQPPALLATDSMAQLEKTAAPGRWKRRLQRYLAFAVPMLCDVTATTTLNLGLSLTTASTFQMLRGTLVLFTGLMSVLLLRRMPRPHQWTGMGCIAGGAFVVGMASVVSNPTQLELSIDIMHPLSLSAPTHSNHVRVGHVL